MTNTKLVQYLIQREVLRTPDVIDAFFSIDRSLFIPKKFINESYMDYPLPIGDGKTIVQPSSAAIILELLQPTRGDFVLEIGAGSAWLTALISKLIGEEGYINAFEVNRVVGEFGKSNMRKFLFDNYSFKIADAKKHWLENAPYNRIISKSVLEEDEESELVDLLVPNGVMVVPTKEKDIKRITKDIFGNVHERKYSSFVYVPLS